MKRVLSLTLVLVMILGIFACVPVSAAGTNFLLFRLNSDGESYTVVGCDEYWNSDLVIPSTYADKPVTSIREYAFVDCPYISSVTIPDSVVDIGESAFSSCEDLRTVNLGNGVKSIGNNAFSKCKKLVSFTGGDNVETYGESAFIDCKKLESFVISDKATVVPKYIFSGCESIQKVVIGDGVKRIDEYAFSGCINLTDAEFGDNLETIGVYGFRNCESLTTLEIPGSVTTIEDFAFVGCDALINIEIPDSVKTIGEGVFTYCPSLMTINVAGENPIYSSVDGVLYDKDKTTIIRYPAGRVVTEFKIPDSVTTIGDTAFYNCVNLVSLLIPDSVTIIGDSAFYGCKNLEINTIPDSVTTIRGGAFGECDKIKTFVMPDIVTDLGSSVFHFCRNLVSVKLSDNITKLPSAIFQGCANLTSVDIPESVEIIERQAFSQCSKLNNVNIHNNIKSIGDSAFEFCDGLTSITIGDGVTSIGDYAFYYCNKINNVVYAGSKDGWEKIKIGAGNDVIKNNINYEIPSKPETPKVATTNELNGIKITWNAVEDAVKYEVYRRQAGQKKWTLLDTTTSTAITDTKVTSGIYYCYSIRAYNKIGQYSDYIAANAQNRKYMATPKLTGISNATNGLCIKWNAVNGNGRMEYRVYRRGAGSTSWTYLGTTTSTTWIDSGVKNASGGYYRYTVRAVQGTNGSGWYSAFDTNGLYLKRLANPALKSAVSSSAGITVKWGAVSGTTGYYVYRKTANSGWVRIASVGGTNNTTYLDKTARKGVTYTYTVRAVYGATTSAYNSGISCKDKY